MASESSQKWLERNRPPRVQITYEVETGGAMKKRELPLVVGILANLSGRPDTEKRKLTEQRFIEVDRDNFDNVMEKIAPTLDVAKMGQKPGLAKGTIAFTKLEHFEPAYLVAEVDGLKQLYVQRQRLRDLMAKIDGNSALYQALTAEIGKGDKRFDGWLDATAEPDVTRLETLSKEDIARISDATFANATKSQLLSLKPEQVKAVTVSQYKALDADKQAAFKEKHKANVSQELAVLIADKAAPDVTKLETLKADEIAGMPEATFAKATKDQLVALTPEQAKAVTAAQYQALDADKQAAFKEKHKANVSDAVAALMA
jgi:type VI secretion system protein ImpB